MPGVLFDTNIWIAAVFTVHPCHSLARTALRDATPAVPAVFCRSTQQSFLRLATTPALLKVYGAEKMTNRDALVTLDALMALPGVCELGEPPGTTALWRQLASCGTASPKVWMDAYLAAFAISGNLSLVTLDQDFKAWRIHGLRLTLHAPDP